MNSVEEVNEQSGTAPDATLQRCKDLTLTGKVRNSAPSFWSALQYCNLKMDHDLELSQKRTINTIKPNLSRERNVYMEQ